MSHAPRFVRRRALGLARENDRIVVFGSFYTVAAVLREIGQDRTFGVGQPNP